MIVTVEKKEPKEFVPRTLSINFSTQEQWDLFRWMCSCNLSVPDTVFKNSYHYRHTLENMLHDIHDAMRQEGVDYSPEFKAQ